MKTFRRFPITVIPLAMILIVCVISIGLVFYEDPPDSISKACKGTYEHEGFCSEFGKTLVRAPGNEFQVNYENRYLLLNGAYVFVLNDATLQEWEKVIGATEQGEWLRLRLDQGKVRLVYTDRVLYKR